MTVAARQLNWMTICAPLRLTAVHVPLS